MKGDNDREKVAASFSESSGEMDGTLTEQDQPVKGRLTLVLLLATCWAALGSSFQFGYNIGVINQPKEVVQKWINESNTALFGSPLTKERQDDIWSVIVSIYAVGGMGGGLLSGVIALRFGRKGGMLINNIVAFISAALLGFSKLTGCYFVLILGRLCIGFNAGLNTALVPMYLTEISSFNLRGALGTVHQLVTTISIWISMILGLPQLLGTPTLWPLLFGLTAVPAVFQVATAWLTPESPEHTLIVLHNEEKAETDLMKLRGTANVTREIEHMEAEHEKVLSAPKLRFRDMFTDPSLRWPLFIAVMMMFSQQLSGINVAMYYSNAVFKSAGLSDSEASYATIGMGAINVIMTIVSTFTVDRFGRRPLHLIGMSGMWLVSIGLVICLTYTPKIGDVESSKWPAYMAIVLVLLFVIFFATGPGSVPWFFVSELFMQNARPHANSVAVVANWLSNLVVGLIFLPLQNAIDQYSFLFFTFFLTIFIIFTYFYVPETKNRLVEDIVEDFRRGKRRQ